MEQGWDPDVKKYFSKILNSVAWGILWLMGIVYGGIYHELAYNSREPLHAIMFYSGALFSLFLLIRYLVITWKTGQDK
jgi:hypothetical protein